MAYKAVARGALLSAGPRTKTVVIDTGEGGDIVVVLVAPPENAAIALHEAAQGDEGIDALELAAKLTIMMAYSPKDGPGGDGYLDLAKDGEDPICMPGEQMFSVEHDLKTILALPIGHPVGELRSAAADFAKELGEGKKSSDTDADTGITVSPKSLEESTSETSESGTEAA